MTRPLALAGVLLVAALWARDAFLVAAADGRVDALARRLAAVEAHVGDVDLALAVHEHDAAVGAEAWAQRCRWRLQHSQDSESLRDLVAVRCPRCPECQVTWASADDGGRP